MARYYYTAYTRDDDGYLVSDLAFDVESAWDGVAKIHASVADIDWQPIEWLPAGVLAVAVGELTVVIHRV